MGSSIKLRPFSILDGSRESGWCNMPRRIPRGTLLTGLILSDDGAGEDITTEAGDDITTEGGDDITIE